MQKQLDILSIEKRYEAFEKDTNYGNPDELKRFIRTIDLNASTRPEPFSLNDIAILPMEKKVLEPPDGIKVRQEKLILPARIKTGNPDFDKPVFYLLRKGDLNSRKCIIIVPGGHVTTRYFSFLKDSFNELIKRDYDILFYIPPFKLCRKINRDDKNNDLIILNTRHNIYYMLLAVSELRSAISCLKQMQVSSIGLFGGSTGGSMVLLVSILEKVDHVSVMEPVVDWSYTLVKNPHLGKLRQKMYRAGFNNDLLIRAYRTISPLAYKPGKNQNNIQILYPRNDQYTPKHVIDRFVKKWNIKHFNEYKRGHVTVLINDSMFKGYFSFLDNPLCQESCRLH